jgi:5-methylcytosine-specific restriction endonuclease McrA
MDKKTINRIKNHLRRASRIRKSVNNVVKSQKVYAPTGGVYKTGKKKGKPRMKPTGFRCEYCQEVVTKIEVDHTVEIGEFPLRSCGKPDWNKWIDKLFCDESNLQVLCPKCHRDKTAAFNCGRPKGEYYV